MGREVVIVVTSGRLNFGTWERIFMGKAILAGSGAAALFDSGPDTPCPGLVHGSPYGSHFRVMTLIPSCWYAIGVGGSAKVNQELIRFAKECTQLHIKAKNVPNGPQRPKSI
jgi:hypothetical protein